MRRILIDEVVAKKAADYAKAMKGKDISLKEWDEGDKPTDRLEALRQALIEHPETEEMAKYVGTIIEKYDELLLLIPDAFKDTYEQHFMKWDGELKKKVSYQGKEKEFYKHVIDSMGYADIRSNLLRYLTKEQGIKTCVYCNAQYAITTEEYTDKSNQTKRVGTYQFDHYWPESDYPFLCTSFYNLQPCCATCNQSKKDREALFNLYTDKEDKLDVFKFELTPDKALAAYVGQDMENLEVKLASGNSELLKNHQDLFHIDLIYAQHIEVVQRIIVLLRANSDYYRISLQESLEALFPMGVEDPESFFFGFHMKREYVHRQPLNMLVQDVVEVLK